MDEMYISSIYRNTPKQRHFKKPKFFLPILLILSFVIYLLLISPLLENSFKNFLLKSVRKRKIVTLNYLTPLYNQQIYASEYILDTLASAGLKNKPSRTSIQTEDTRVIALQKFLFNYNSPMYPFSKTFIIEADKYQLDWRLVVSISGVESAFGNLIPRGENNSTTYNAWGWRGENRTPDGWSQFESWDHAITVVTERMALGYGTNLTPMQIEPTYCPPCGLNPAHLWANGVSRFMRELSEYERNLK